MPTIRGKAKQSKVGQTQPTGRSPMDRRVAKSSPSMEAKKGNNRTRTQLGQG